MKTKSIFFVLFIIIHSLQAQEKKFRKDELIADIDTLYVSINEIHPDMFAKYSQKDFERNITDIKSRVRDSMSTIDLYKLVAPLVAKLGDAHTSVFLPNNTLRELNCLIFPFDVDIEKSNYTIIVNHNYSDLNVPIGTKIVSINGKNSKDLITELLKYKSGEKELFKIELIKKEFSPLLYTIYRDSVITIKYQLGNAIITKDIVGISYSEWKTKQNKNKNNRNNYTLSTNLKDNLAIIDFKSFEDYPKFKLFLDSTFSEMKKRRSTT